MKRAERRDEMPITKEMAVNARIRRQDAGMSLYRLACRVGCTPQTIINLEHQHTKCIKIHNFEQLATALGVESEELQGFDDYVEPPIMLKSKTIRIIEKKAMAKGYGDDIEHYLEDLFNKS